MSTRIPPHRMTSEKQMALDAGMAKGKDLFERKIFLEEELARIGQAIAESRTRCGVFYNADAPIFSLHDEITALIFWFSVCSVEQPRLCIEGQRLIEVVVSHVCQRWRIIAVNQSDLWSTFYVNISQESPRIPLDRLDAYLERSKNKLLDLSLTFGAPLGVADEQKCQETLQLPMNILPHHERWYRLHIVALDSAHRLTEAFDALEDLYVPNLVHFSLCTGRSDVGEEWDQTLGIRTFNPKIFHAGAPRLSSLLLDGTAAAVGRPPSSNITTLRIERCRPGDKSVPWTTDALLEVFTIPTLSDLSMAGDFQPEELHSSPSSLRPVLAPRLQNLRIGRANEDSNFMMEVLQFVEAPQLTSMLLYGIEYAGDQTHTMTTPFPSLKTLILDECVFSGSNLVAHLAGITSTVTRLTITHGLPNFYMGESSAIGWLSEQQALWPGVKVVTLGIKEPTIMPYLKFIEGTPDCRRYAFAICPNILSELRKAKPRDLARIEDKLNIVPQVHEDRHKWPPGEDVSGRLVPFIDPFPMSTCSCDIDLSSE